LEEREEIVEENCTGENGRAKKGKGEEMEMKRLKTRIPSGIWSRLYG